MVKVRRMVLASLICVTTVSVWAQGGGMGGGGMGRGMQDSPGWAMMTEQERNEHRERMRSMKSYDECKAYQQQHHEQMAARAKERGAKPLAAPRRDPCSGLKR